MSLSLIREYFPDLSEAQIARFQELDELYRFWNERINVISRKDISNLYTHHVLHSLSIAKFIRFKPATRVLDAGTGGGFPGIPLAIMFPDVHFTLSDSIQKKIRVVNEISGALKLNNTIALTERVEKLTGPFDFVVSRAVTGFPGMWDWVRASIQPGGNNELANGMVYLKGDDLAAEKALFGNRLQIVPLDRYFRQDYFLNKNLVYLPAGGS